jgi:hypothetical protein
LQRAYGKKCIGKEFFAECLLSDTRQRLYRVQTQHSAKKSGHHGGNSVSACFAECHVRGTRQRFLFFFQNFFAECPASEALGKDFFYFL